MEDDDVIDAMLEQVWRQQDVHKYGLGLTILNLAHSRQHQRTGTAHLRYTR
jgi:hypothetical protein